MELIKAVAYIYNHYFRSLVDIAVLAFVIYYAYNVLVKTRAAQLLKGLGALLILYAFAFILKLQTLLWLLNALAPGLVIGLAIIFQAELRKFFFKIGETRWWKSRIRSQYTDLETVLTAAEILSDKRRGMLLVFLRRNGLKDVGDTGTYLNADLSSSLIVTIFGHDTPLHDGAVIVQNSKILSAGCFLPLSEQADIRKSFGTRHRAALGLSEESDAVVLVVSEETGAFSIACDSKLYYDLTSDDVIHRLSYLLGITKDTVHESVL